MRSRETIESEERWDKFWSGWLGVVIVALVFMLIADPMKRQPVLGDRAQPLAPAGYTIPLDLGMN